MGLFHSATEASRAATGLKKKCVLGRKFKDDSCVHEARELKIIQAVGWEWKLE